MGKRCRVSVDVFDEAEAGLVAKGLAAADAHNLLLDEALWDAPEAEGARAAELQTIPGDAPAARIDPSAIPTSQTTRFLPQWSSVPGANRHRPGSYWPRCAAPS